MAEQLRHIACSVVFGIVAADMLFGGDEEMIDVDGNTIVPYLKPGLPFAISWGEKCEVRTHAPPEWRSRFALGILSEGVPDRSNQWTLPVRQIPNTAGHVLLFEGQCDCTVTLLGLEKPEFNAKLLRHVRTRGVLPILQHKWNLNPLKGQGRDIWLGEQALLPVMYNKQEWLDAILDALGLLVLTSE